MCSTGGPHYAGHSGAANQKGAPAHPRQSHCQPLAASARGRRNGYDRRHLTRSVGVRLCAQSPDEAAPANVLPLRGMQRLWEAHDMIIKAWTTHDGPFSFEGRWFHARQINIWPRPYQQPHPPIWITVGSGRSTIPVAQHKYTGRFWRATRASARSTTAIAPPIAPPTARRRHSTAWPMRRWSMLARMRSRPVPGLKKYCGT